MHRLPLTHWTLALVVSLASGFSTAQAAPTFSPPALDRLQAAALDWAKGRGANESAQREAISSLWPSADTEATTEDKMDSLMRTFYLVDSDVRSLIDGCISVRSAHGGGDFAALQSHPGESLFTNNVRYFYGRYLSTLTLYEESLDLFSQIEPEHLVDPAGFFFYKAVCQHALLQKDAGLASIETLTGNVAAVPVRYQQLGAMMKQDLEALEEQSLGEIASQMKDAQRRLTLGRAGERSQRVEEQIITSLDAIIAKLEQCNCGGGNGGGKPGGKPASDGYTKGVKGPGATDAKNLGHQDNWGNLPEKSQSAAKNMINRQFPAHYRQAVEEYLKKLANRPAAHG